MALLIESVDKFCTLAVPSRRFVSESQTLSASSAASKINRKKHYRFFFQSEKFSFV